MLKQSRRSQPEAEDDLKRQHDKLQKDDTDDSASESGSDQAILSDAECSAAGNGSEEDEDDEEPVVPRRARRLKRPKAPMSEGMARLYRCGRNVKNAR